MSDIYFSAATAIERSWTKLADGLLTQRLFLHLDETREVTTQHDNPPPGVTGVPVAADLVAIPSIPMTADTELVTAAGLSSFTMFPQRFGVSRQSRSPLEASATAQADAILGPGDAEDEVVTTIRAAAAAAAWWVGFFGTIRHTAPHYRSLEPITAAVDVETLRDAARVLALGVVTRVLETRLRLCNPAQVSEAASAYCRAVVAALIIERNVPSLLDRLADKRSVELVSLSIPWSGQFATYQSGVGAGQAS